MTEISKINIIDIINDTKDIISRYLTSIQHNTLLRHLPMLKPLNKKISYTHQGV